MFWDISIVYMHSANYVKAADTIRYNSNTSELQVIEMFELLKVEKIIIFSEKLCVRIIRASELIEDIRYLRISGRLQCYIGL